MATFLAVLNAIRAIPQIASYVEKLMIAISAWQDEQKAKRVEDSLVLAKHAKSKEDRAAAAKAIHDALNS